MQIWRSFDDVPADLGRTVVTIGNFDGVHLGHRHVLAQARATAADLGVDTVVVVTFDPHPMAVLRPEHAPPILTSIETRARLLEEAGIDAVLVIPFDREIAGWSPEEFIDRVLVGTLHARAVVVGANFRFGNRAAGDVALLREVGRAARLRRGGVALDGGPQVWSSTYVRQCLATGDVPGPRRHSAGLHRARRRRPGRPARSRARLPDRQRAHPGRRRRPGRRRVRRLATRRDTGERFPAAISVGTNPTFDGERERRVESYVLDRDDLELYGVEVEVEFVERLRGMVKFEGVEALIETMHDDVRRARTILGQRP